MTKESELGNPTTLFLVRLAIFMKHQTLEVSGHMSPALL